MKYFYEFIGTFFLVFTVGMTVIEPNSAEMMAPLAIGSVLAVLVYAGAHISGGHYNPAVSLAVYFRGKLSLKDLGIYCLSQFAAAFIAALVTLYFKDVDQVTQLDLDLLPAFLGEFLFTFALCFVVLNVATIKETKGNSYYGFAIGFTVLVGAYAIGSISGAAFNPAVGLGITLMQLIHWSNLWIFFAANLLGGAVAAYVFNAAHAKTETTKIT